MILIVASLVPLYWWMMPKRPEQMRKVDRELLAREDEADEAEDPDTPAGKLERFWPLNLILAGAIITYFISSIVSGTFTFDFNAVIALFLALGLILHWTPIRYVRTFTGSAGAIRPIALQYPLYGKIQGLMTLSVSGVTLAAQEAHRVGLVNKVVPDEKLEEEAAALVGRLAELPAQALGRIKQTLHKSFESVLAAALEAKAVGQTFCGHKQDHKEGIAAFFEKRDPTFTGR